MLTAADLAIQRAVIGKPARSQILLGLRGTGKTVLLNRFDRIAEAHGAVTAYVEAPDDRSLPEILYPKLHKLLRSLSIVEEARSRVHTAFQGLKGFASGFKVSVGDVSIAYDTKPGLVDSGQLETDLTDLFVLIGQAAESADKGWVLIIDEVQYLSQEEWAALIVALHRMNQLALPVVFFGAGLPQLAAISGNAKSYAERLFEYFSIGPLDATAAGNAIRQPIVSEAEAIDDDAVSLIAEQTMGYPYFLQEWGFQAWNCTEESPITSADVETASSLALTRLDEGFFRVRLGRLTPKEREYVVAMARLGDGPYRSSDVADQLGESQQSLGPRRAQIINKGMIYSPAHGDIAFTVPLFEAYLRRTYP